jgi:hypothetical protein
MGNVGRYIFCREHFKVANMCPVLYMCKRQRVCSKNKCRKFITKYSKSTIAIYDKSWISSSAGQVVLKKCSENRI